MKTNQLILKAGFLALFMTQVGSLWAQGFPAQVRVVEASMEMLSPEAMVPGTVISRNDAKLSAEVEGRLVFVADVGTEVVAGDTLASIEDLSLKLFNRELQAEIGREQARLKFLEGELKRFSKLAESNLAAATQLDQTRADRDVARGDLEVARARLAQNEDQLRRTNISAPFEGIVVQRLMTPGERVTEGSVVVRLVDQKHLEVIARAPLDYYAFVKKGQSLSLSSNTQSGTGIVRTVVAVGNENTHLFELRLDLEGRPFQVGQTLRVAVPTAETKAVLTVPRDALVLRPEGLSVFIVDSNDQAQQVSVKTGVGSGDQIEILGEISSGDRVVIRGNERLETGQSVDILGS
jgi:RND family efflux transporter MFP subunit